MLKPRFVIEYDRMCVFVDDDDYDDDDDEEDCGDDDDDDGYWRYSLQYLSEHMCVVCMCVFTCLGIQGTSMQLPKPPHHGTHKKRENDVLESDQRPPPQYSTNVESLAEVRVMHYTTTLYTHVKSSHHILAFIRDKKTTFWMRFFGHRFEFRVNPLIDVMVTYKWIC